MNVANHPEYPSATASFCAAHATAYTAYAADRNEPNNPDGTLLDWTVPYAAGSSFVEPGVTPAQDIVLHYQTWEDMKQACGISRLYGGVHFFDSIPAGQGIGDVVGAAGYRFLKPFFEGTAY